MNKTHHQNKSNFLEQIPENIITWLLEPSNPSIRYRTMVELQGLPLDSDTVKKAQSAIMNYPVVQAIFKKMHPEGYWESTNAAGQRLGSGTEYTGYTTTHFVLAYLAELGLTREEPYIEKAAHRYLSLQQPDGDFFRHFSCLYGLNIRTFTKLGFQDDPRLLKTVNLLKNAIRYDNGYLCDLHEGKRKKRRVKSCYRGTVKALFAVAEMPHLWTEPFSKQLITYFLKRDVLYKTTDLNEWVNREAGRTLFPFTWRAGLLELVYSLAKMGYGEDPRVHRAWQILHEHRKSNGRYILDWTPPKRSNMYFDPGKRQKENKWITFYAYLCLKYKLYKI